MKIRRIGWREWTRWLWQWRSQLARSSRFPAGLLWLGVLIPTPGWTRWGSAQVVGRSFRMGWWSFPLVVWWAVIASFGMAAVITTGLTRNLAMFLVGVSLIVIGTMNFGPLFAACSRHWDHTDVWTDNLVRDPDADPRVGAHFSQTRMIRLFELDPQIRSVGFRAGDKRLVEYWTAVYPNTDRMGKVFRVPVITISQLNRSVETREDKRPRLADLRESGALEQDSDIINMLYRDEYYYPEWPDNAGVGEVIIAKHRNRRTRNVDLAFVASQAPGRTSGR